MLDLIVFLLDLLSVFQRGADRPPPRRPLLGAVVAGALLAFFFQLLGLAAWLFLVYVGYVSTIGALYVFVGAALILGVVAGWALLRKFERALARQPPDRYPPAKHPWWIGAVSGSITFLPVFSASYFVVHDAWYAVAIGALGAIVLAVVVARYEYRRASTWPPVAPGAKGI